jgi:hypothetical protein
MGSAKRFKPFIYFLAGWIVPGFGHFLQGRRGKAAVFFFGVLSMIGLGLLMHGGFAPWTGTQPLGLISFLAGLGSGLPWVAAKAAGLGAGDLWAYTYQYGTAYIAAAGFMNLLIALNALGAAQESRHV